jgi:Tfp pilus assembly protein PilX
MGYMRNRKRIMASERGAALVIALFIIAVLTVLGVLVLNTSIVEVKMAINQQVSSRVFYAAEAGLERALKVLIGATAPMRWPEPSLRPPFLVRIPSMWPPAPWTCI